MCVARDLRFRVVTNGSFAHSFDVARKQLSELRDIGLNTVGLSWDSFHRTFIDPQCAINVIRACRELGISVQLTCVVTKRSTVAYALESLGDEGFDLKTVQVKCLPVGRAERKISADQFLPASDWESNRACQRDFDTVSLVHDGSVYPCCAVGGFTDAIALGRYPDTSIVDLLRRREDDFKWMVLASQGPTFLMKFASHEELAESGACEGLHDCVNCHRLFRKALGDVLVERARHHVSEAVAKVFDEHDLV